MTGLMWMPTDAPTLGRLLAWHPQPIPLFDLVCVLAALLYLVAVVELRRRRIPWPLHRSLLFLLGLVTIVGAVGTGLGGYGMQLFSVHMVQHMLLSMIAPILLLLGAPMTLLLRVLPARSRRRAVVLAIVHSRIAALVTHPLVTVPLFLGSLYGLYFTPLIDIAMGSWLGHTWMLAHFIVVGLLFFWPIVGVDPGPRRVGYPMRMFELFVTMPFHAFFGISIMMAATPLTGSFTTPATWGRDALADQVTGGSIAWAFSEIPTVIVLVALFLQWSRADDRVARAADRQAVRDDDAERTRYNDYLASLARQR